MSSYMKLVKLIKSRYINITVTSQRVKQVQTTIHKPKDLNQVFTILYVYTSCKFTSANLAECVLVKRPQAVFKDKFSTGVDVANFQIYTEQLLEQIMKHFNLKQLYALMLMRL